MGGYHFHKECKYFPDCTEEIIKKGKKEMILFKCPAGNNNKGSLYYKGDLHSIKYTCTAFEPSQMAIGDYQ